MRPTPKQRWRLAVLTGVLTAAACAAEPASAGYEVVLRDGRLVSASSRPVIALGRVSFHDAEGHGVSLAAREVDLPATRRLLHREGDEGERRVWTRADLAASTGHVQVVGGRLPDGGGEPTAPGTGVASVAELEARQADLLRERLDELESQRRLLSTSDPEAQLLEKRRLVLQSELLRLLRDPSSPLHDARAH
jgi:hypothetical protein